MQEHEHVSFEGAACGAGRGAGAADDPGVLPELGAAGRQERRRRLRAARGGGGQGQDGAAGAAHGRTDQTQVGQDTLKLKRVIFIKVKH